MLIMRLVERFNVTGDSGETFVAVVYQDVVDASHMGGHATVDGMKEVRLSDGRTLTYADENQWRIVQTGELVRRA